MPQHLSLPDHCDGAERLLSANARHVLVTRAAQPALLFSDDDRRERHELVAPVFEALDHRGTGDSLVAATGVGLARGLAMTQALRLGVAAGALNATRRGLGTGTRDEIERLAAHVTSAPSRSAPMPDPPGHDACAAARGSSHVGVPRRILNDRPMTKRGPARKQLRGSDPTQ